MYKTAKYFLESKPSKPIEYFVYNGPNYSQHQIVENVEYTPIPKTDDIISVDSKNNEKTYEKTDDNLSTSNPKIWGPPLWFTLHNMASKYPIKASPTYISKMKDFITGIPYILPCEVCKVHANNYIEENKNNLDDICSGRDKLFKFFVDFHNSVNKRTNKKEISYEEAYKIYKIP